MHSIYICQKIVYKHLKCLLNFNPTVLFWYESNSTNFVSQKLWTNYLYYYVIFGRRLILQYPQKKRLVLAKLNKPCTFKLRKYDGTDALFGSLNCWKCTWLTSTPLWCSHTFQGLSNFLLVLMEAGECGLNRHYSSFVCKKTVLKLFCAKIHMCIHKWGTSFVFEGTCTWKQVVEKHGSH